MSCPWVTKWSEALWNIIALIPALGRQRQAELCELETGLISTPPTKNHLTQLGCLPQPRGPLPFFFSFLFFGPLPFFKKKRFIYFYAYEYAIGGQMVWSLHVVRNCI